MHHLHVENGALWGYLWHFAHLQHVDLAENALFKVPDELSMNRSDSDGFFLR